MAKIASLVPRRAAVAALLLPALLLGGACGGRKRPPVLAGAGGAPADAVPSPPGPGRSAPQPIEGGPDVAPIENEGAFGEEMALDPATEQQGPLADVHFAFDQADLDDAARATLEKHAVWLQSNRDARVTIEGHCDERGTVEYNLALGERRAAAARDYLVSLGVAAERLSIVSLGKERPLDPGHDEAAWAKNRRAHFVVTR